MWHLYVHLLYAVQSNSLCFIFFLLLSPFFSFFPRKGERMNEGHDRMGKKKVMSCKGKRVQMGEERDLLGGDEWMTVQAQLG